MGKSPEGVRKILEDAREIAEREALACTDGVRNIYEAGSSLADDMSRLREQADSGGHRIDRLMTEQAGAVDEFRSQVATGLGAQRDVATEAVAQVESIGKLSELLGSIALASRVLAVNTRVEAARSGSNGRAFSVIASNMQDLNKQIMQAAGTITELTEHLRSVLERVAGQAMDINSSVGQHSQLLVKAFGQVQEVHGALQSATISSIEGGADQAESLRNGANEMLLHLQSQDRVCQMIGEAADVMAGNRTMSANLQDASGTEAGGEGEGGEDDGEDKETGEVCFL